MLRGTANLEELAARAPTTSLLDGDALHLSDVDVLYAVWEIGHEGREDLLPPGLHPTEPGHATFVFYRVRQSAFGPFAFATARIGCRSGARPRGFELASFIDNQAAGQALRERFGMRCDPAVIRLVPRYSGATATVTVGGRTILDMFVRDPVTLTGADIQYTSTLTLARTPQGLRLVQVEPEYTVQRAERGTPQFMVFDAAAWGSPLLRPAHGVSASLARVDFSFSPVRFVLRPDVTASEGTERINRSQPG